MLLRKLSNLAWLVDPSVENCYYLLTCTVDQKFAKQPSHACFNAALVSSEPDDLSVVVVDQELWANSLFTADPRSTLVSVVRDFIQCSDPNFPIELVYNWGGQLRSCDIKIARPTLESLQ